MRRLLLLFSIVSLYNVSIAQEITDVYETKNRIFIDFSGSFPNGDFGDTDASNRKSGFAESGRSLNIGYHYNLSNSSYLTVTYRAFSHSIDLEEFSNEVGLNHPSISSNIEFDGYVIKAVTFGYKYLHGKKSTKVYINPFLGFGSMVVGELSINASGPGGTITSVQRENDAAGALAFLYGINGGIELRLSELINLNFQLGIAGANFEIETIVEAVDVNGIFIAQQNNYEQPFSAFTAGLSLGFNF